MTMVRNLLKNMARVTPVSVTLPSKSINVLKSLQYQNGNQALRYIVRDKTPLSMPGSNLTTIYIRELVENKDFLRKMDREKKQRFQRMETVQNQCKITKLKNNIAAQTIYDPGQPDLWKRVKDMYNPMFLSHTSPYHVFLR